MSEEKKNDQMPGADGQNSPVGNDQQAEPKDQSVDVNGLLKAKNEILAEKKKLQAQLDKIKKEKEDEERKKLEEQGKYKELVDSLLKEKEELKNKTIQLSKKQVIKDELSKRSIKPKWGKFLDESLFEFDEEMNITNGDHVFEQFKDEFPEAFQNTPAPQMTAGNPAKVNTKNQSKLDQFLELSGEEFDKNAESMLDDISKSMGWS